MQLLLLLTFKPDFHTGGHSFWSKSENNMRYLALVIISLCDSVTHLIPTVINVAIYDHLWSSNDTENLLVQIICVSLGDNELKV